LHTPALRVPALITVLSLSILSLVAPLSAEAAKPVIRQRSATVATTDVLPTVQIDGVVWTQLVVGNRVFAGGEFKNARPAGAAPGTQLTPRWNLLAYDVRNGKLIKSFAPRINGQVKALAVSPNRKTLYVAGLFNKVGSASRPYVAAFSVKTGKLRSFKAAPNGVVNALAASSKTVYLGGTFTRVSGKSRSRLAAVTTTGKVRRWAPKANRAVLTMVLARKNTKLVVGGRFDRLNKTKARGVGAVSATTGKTQSFKINRIVRNSGSHSAIVSLKRRGSTIYGTGYAYGTGNFEGVFAASEKTGAMRWIQDCHGDTYDVAPIGNTVYSVGHAHYCANIGGFPDSNPRSVWYRGLAVTAKAAGKVGKNGQPTYTVDGKIKNYGEFVGRPAPALINWFPNIAAGSYTKTSQGAWSITATKSFVLLGGEFPSINGVRQQGLARMAIPTKAPRKQGPNPSSTLRPNAQVVSNGDVRLSWRATYDRDDLKLMYTVRRNGAVVYRTTRYAALWDRITMSWTDTGAPGSGPLRYQVTVRDGDGNEVWGAVRTVR
jgi:hypothetical protein